MESYSGRLFFDKMGVNPKVNETSSKDALNHQMAYEKLMSTRSLKYKTNNIPRKVDLGLKFLVEDYIEHHGSQLRLLGQSSLPNIFAFVFIFMFKLVMKVKPHSLPSLNTIAKRVGVVKMTNPLDPEPFIPGMIQSIQSSMKDFISLLALQQQELCKLVSDENFDHKNSSLVAKSNEAKRQMDILSNQKDIIFQGLQHLILFLTATQFSDKRITEVSNRFK